LYITIKIDSINSLPFFKDTTEMPLFVKVKQLKYPAHPPKTQTFPKRLPASGGVSEILFRAQASNATEFALPKSKKRGGAKGAVAFLISFTGPEPSRP
jgi:hypothetical protein